MATLVTGAAGFIGSHVCQRLLAQNCAVIGLDNLNHSYAIQLKKDRLDQLKSPDFRFIKLDMADSSAMESLFTNYQIDQVIHLAAESGLQTNTQLTEQAACMNYNNIIAFSHLLDNCRKHNVRHVVYASTAAVYGDNADFPVTEQSNSDQPLSLYAASKKANEVLAHSYAHQFDLPLTGLRFFTVYGPWGRPDMVLYLFTQQILAGLPLNIHNNGDHSRDFIYIDDLVEAVLIALQNPPQNQTPHQIYNLGSQKALGLMEMVQTLEQQLGQTTAHQFLPRQKQEIQNNQADASLFNQQFGFEAQTDFVSGVKRFVAWYRDYHSV